MTSLLADAFEHHVWATLRLIDACAELAPEQLETTVPGTFGSILSTMQHLVGADASYLALVSGGERSEIDEDTMDLSALRAVMEENGPLWQRLLASDPDPTVEVVRRRDDGSTSSAPMGVRLAQAIHHGTEHRSQVCTVITSLGVNPPQIDVWDMASSQGRLTATEPTS